MLGECFVLQKHFQPVLTNSQRCLKFVRSIADEEFLLLEYGFAVSCMTEHRLIQLAELGGLCRIVQRRILLAQTEMIQPLQQAIEGLHAPMEHPYVDEEDGHQQGNKKSDQQLENGFLQVPLLDSRGVDGHFEMSSFLIFKQSGEDTCRFGFVLLGNVNHRVTIGDSLT